MNFKELGANLGLEEDEYRELIDLFLDSGGQDLERLKSAAATGDFDLAVRSAHTIKGAAGNLGLSDLQQMAGRIESCAAGRKADGLQEGLLTLNLLFKRMRAQVQVQ